MATSSYMIVNFLVCNWSLCIDGGEPATCLTWLHGDPEYKLSMPFYDVIHDMHTLSVSSVHVAVTALTVKPGVAQQLIADLKAVVTELETRTDIKEGDYVCRDFFIRKYKRNFLVVIQIIFNGG